MRTPYSLHRRSYYPWLFLALVLGANGLGYVFLPVGQSPSIYLTITGAIGGLVHFLYLQHNHSTLAFIDLFREFNVRYDKLNSPLNMLLQRNGELLLSDEDKLLLYDYFNLCAEEYLYFKAGYIDGEVWKAWRRGMNFFARNAAVRHLWDDELKYGSYYGFTLEFVDDVI